MEGIEGPIWIPIVVMAAHFVASLLNTVVKERWPVVGKVINAIALGFGKAKPDPKLQ